MWHSHLNDMEIPETKHCIPKGFELGTPYQHLHAISHLQCIVEPP